MITVVANLKGGTGKSTLAFNLAVWLLEAGVAVRVVDLDPQETLTDIAILRMGDGIDPALNVQSGPFENKNACGEDEEILVDVGTSDLDSFKQALRQADRVLIPVTPSQADVWSTQRFVQFLQSITEDKAPEMLVFINRADTDPSLPDTEEAAAALQSLPGVRLLSQRLGDRSVFCQSFSGGAAVFEAYPESRGSAEFVTLAEAIFGQNRRVVDAPRQETGVPRTLGSDNRDDLAASSAERIFGTAGRNDDDIFPVVAKRQLIGKEVESTNEKHEATQAYEAYKPGLPEHHDYRGRERQAEIDKPGKKDKKGKKHKKGKKKKKGKKGKGGKKAKKAF